MSHTPGPWICEDACVYAFGESGHNRFYCLVQGSTSLRSEMEANARLIAAAPELLAALREMLDNGGLSTVEWMPMKTIKTARAAIAKAEGRS